MLRKRIKYAIVGLLGLGLAACSNPVVFEEVATLPSSGWAAGDTLGFTIPIADTAQVCNVLLHVRNTKNYSYSNLWVFVTTHAPNGHTQRDTLELILADASGRWLGKGTRSINTQLITYMNRVKFPVSGIYTLTVEQAMRDTLLKNITDFGFRIEPVN